MVSHIYNFNTALITSVPTWLFQGPQYPFLSTTLSTNLVVRISSPSMLTMAILIKITMNTVEQAFRSIIILLASSLRKKVKPTEEFHKALKSTVIQLAYSLTVLTADKNYCYGNVVQITEKLTVMLDVVVHGDNS